MNTSHKIKISSISILIGSLVFPALSFASTGSGGQLAGDLEISAILQSVIDLITGPDALLVVIIGLVLGGGFIIFARQNDSSGWNRVGKAVIGGTVIFGAVGVATTFFQGAVI